jgi:hypothetical protein
MDRILEFLHEVYESSPGHKILVKTMYDDFEAWVIPIYGMAEFHRYAKYPFHKYLRTSGLYLYKKYYNGVYMTGLRYRGSSEPLDVDALRSEAIAQASSRRSSVSRFRLNLLTEIPLPQAH